MKKMFFHGADQADSDIQDDSVVPNKNGGESKGDGLHHHEIHEDEGGGFHSKHTYPDGREEHDDHSSYDEARNSQDDKFGHAEPDGDEGQSGDAIEMSSDDIAGSYGRKASCK